MPQSSKRRADVDAIETAPVRVKARLPISRRARGEDQRLRLQPLAGPARSSKQGHLRHMAWRVERVLGCRTSERRRQASSLGRLAGCEVVQ